MIYPKLSDGTIDWCVMCKHEGRAIYDGCCECEYTENSDDPPTKYEPKPMTNGERIRSMSDEELADFITDDMCGLICGDPLACEGECKQKMLDWLTKEVRDDEP
jgi:hypothetical protein